jgi:segregation and condensation protein A
MIEEAERGGNGTRSSAPVPEVHSAARVLAPEEPSTAPPAPLPVEGTGYRVHLEQFEGPLDLLLYLIQEEEVDITDIPIARITEQYLESIQDVETLDLDRAGEFLLMAATLMRIKAKMLIPHDEEEDEEDRIDPRSELVRRLLEYREFKRVAETLGLREEEWRGIFGRAAAPAAELREDDEGDLGVSLIELFSAFHKILQELERSRPIELQTEEVSVTECMELIRERCATREEGVPFVSLFEKFSSRRRLITTFLALLELVRVREVTARQVERFGEIWIKAAKEAAATP